MAAQMTPLEIVAYYANLLILQYLGKPKAYATISTLVSPVIMPQVSVQLISFSDVASSGSFTLKYGFNSAVINWNDSVVDIQNDLIAMTGSSLISVSGGIDVQYLSITFNGVTSPLPVPLLEVTSNALFNLSVAIEITVTETDQTLPIAVQDSFNLIAPNLAAGVQLDILGKYAGVVRNHGTTILNDTDFLTLIRFAIVQNNSGSSLNDIENNLNQVFPGDFIISDSKDMRMTYIFNSTLINSALLNVLVDEMLLPKPMGVALVVIVAPSVVDFFGFRTYDSVNNTAKPFNTYDSFNTSWIFLSYSNAIVI